MDVDIDAHHAHVRNWKRLKKALENELEFLQVQVRRLMTENDNIQQKSHRRKDELRNLRMAEKETRVRPIIAIFRSFGESLPANDPDVEANDAVVLQARRDMLQKWTGMKDLDGFIRDAQWQTIVVQSGPRPVFNHRENLLIFLITLRKGLSFSNLKLLLGFQKKRARQIFAVTLEELLPWSRRHMFLPDLNLWRQRTPQTFAAVFPGLHIFIADGTPLPCLSSGIPGVQRINWNNKHKEEAKCITLVTTPDEGLVFITPSVPGSTHDREAWNQSKIAELLARRYAGAAEAGGQNTSFAIGGDKGYPGIHVPLHWELYLPNTVRNFPYRDPPQIAPLHGPHAPRIGVHCPKRPQSHMKPKFAAFRRVVEAAIAFLKDNELLVNPEFVFWQDELLNKSIQFSGALFNFNKHNVD